MRSIKRFGGLLLFLGILTIKHGPLQQFGMAEGMTMVYRAADPSMLAAIKPGDKIKFAPDRVNGQFVVTKIEKVRRRVKPKE
jgi:Cu(I)/Ag(I) efflux system periplasmic protein CusF